MDLISPGKQRLSLQHLSKDTCCAPDIYFCIVLPPREHDFWRTVVSGRDISCHLRVLDASQAEIANLEIAILIYENITGLKVTVNHAC